MLPDNSLYCLKFSETYHLFPSGTKTEKLNPALESICGCRSTWIFNEASTEEAYDWLSVVKKHMLHFRTPVSHTVATTDRFNLVLKMMKNRQISSYSTAVVKSFCSRFQSKPKWSSQKQPWTEQICCWLSFVKCVTCSWVESVTHVYVSWLVCFLIAYARVDLKRNISLSFHSYWDTQKKV